MQDSSRREHWVWEKSSEPKKGSADGGLWMRLEERSRNGTQTWEKTVLGSQGCGTLLGTGLLGMSQGAGPWNGL